MESVLYGFFYSLIVSVANSIARTSLVCSTTQTLFRHKPVCCTFRVVININCTYYIKGLSTECEVCTGKYLPERRKQKANTFPVKRYGFWFIFFPVYIALCSSSDVAVYLTSEFLGLASCLHSLGIHLHRL